MMKKILLICSLFLLGMACNRNEEEPQPQFDPPHYEVHISVVNKQTGETLLDPFVYDQANDFLLPKSGVLAICGTNEYELSRFDQPYYDHDAPFRLERYSWDGGYHYRVVFDGFTIEKSFQERLLIYWGEKFDFFTEIMVGAEVDFSKGTPQITRTMTVDGKPVVCEEGKDWMVVIEKEIVRQEPENDYPGPGYDATGKWYITDLEATLNGKPLSARSAEESVFEIHYVDGQTVWMFVNIVLDDRSYTILLPAINVWRDFNKRFIRSFNFDQEITDGNIAIDKVQQKIKKMVVQGEMYWNWLEDSPSSIKPMYVFTPQSDYCSDLTFYVECETFSFELKMKYLQVFSERSWF